MKWYGLTGGLATGKSTVSNILRGMGIPVVDADQLARQVVLRGTAGYHEVLDLFGQGILDGSGELNRTKMGEMVFGNSELKEKLESIVHPKIHELRLQERRSLEQLGFDFAFYDVPLLFEKNLKKEFDAVILVYCSEADQIARLKERNKYSDEQINQRLKAQMPIDQKVKLADYVIMNTGSLSDLKSNVQAVLADLKRNN